MCSSARPGFRRCYATGSKWLPTWIEFRSNIAARSGRVTLAAASSRDKEFEKHSGTKIELAQKVGKVIGEKALAAGISSIRFDRGGYLYHGRVKSLADGAREAGLKF